jgi:hypothetical protein
MLCSSSCRGTRVGTEDPSALTTGAPFGSEAWTRLLGDGGIQDVDSVPW